MKLKELIELKDDEIAVLKKTDGNFVAVANHNVEGGLCGCCMDAKVYHDYEVLTVINAVTGKQVEKSWRKAKISP